MYLIDFAGHVQGGSEIPLALSLENEDHIPLSASGLMVLLFLFNI